MTALAACVVLLLVLPAAHAQALDAEELAGRRLYVDAVTASGEPLRALVGIGRAAISGAAVACRNCHGADGKGKPEASVRPPRITWDELAKPYGRYDERSFQRAVSEGLDPAGKPLDWAMPRYALSASEAAALIAYLKRIGLERDPGIEEHALRIGTVVPPAAREIEAALKAQFEAINQAGGIHRRKLELVAAHDYVDASKRFSEEPVFALLSLLDSGESGGLDRLVTRLKLPVVGPQAAMRDDQARSLVEFAARQSATALARAAIVASHAPAHRRLAQAAAERCRTHGCAEVLAPELAEVVGDLKEGRDHVFFFGSERELALFLEQAEKAAWRPNVYALGATGRAAIAARARFGGRIFLAFPGASPEAAARAAGSVLIEGLRRSGRELSRERFVRALETMSY